MFDNRSIAGTRVLFLAPAFFGYEQKIKSKMEQLGASVDYHDARSVSSSFDKALLKISPGIFRNKTKQYYEDILKANKGKDYDYVFIVKCDMISIHMLKELKEAFSKAKFCLYLWDSIDNIPGVVKKISVFDRVLSFDRHDADNHTTIQFRPLFYTDEFKKKISTCEDKTYKYDLCFCGTVHSDRYRIIKEIKRYCKKNNYVFFTFLYLQSKFVYWFYKFTKREFVNTKLIDFDYNKLSGSAISDIVNDSRVVLDIQHPRQTGLTMRTIEMIGMHKKLLTTNQDIKNYDFYKPNNIHIISRNGIELPHDFLSNEYEPLDNDVYQNYDIENWILDILTE